MKISSYPPLAALLGAGGLLTALGAASVCVFPFVALLLGVGGLGILARYASYGSYALWLSTALVIAGLTAVFRRDPTLDSRCERVARRRSRVLVLIAAAFTLTLHVAEHFVLPSF